MKLLVLFVLLFAFCYHTNSQIINIESKRMRTDTTGWAGEASIKLDVVKYNDYIINLGISSHLQYKHQKYIGHILSDYILVKSAGTHLINTGYLHFRFGYKIIPLLTWEIFTQGQFNKILDVGFRGLIGTGPRFKIYDSDNFRVYAGIDYMYEYEENNSKTIYHRDHRSSNYLTFTIDFKRFVFTHTTYYQPLFKLLKDYMFASQSRIAVKIFKGLSFTAEFNYRYDSNPEPTIPRSTYVVTNGISLSF